MTERSVSLLTYALMRVEIVRHALLVIMIGLIAGFAFAFSLLGEVRISPFPVSFFDNFPGEASRWRAVHLGCLLNGIMALAFAGIAPLFTLSDKAQTYLKRGVQITIWGNTVFYFAGLAAPNHGLSLGDNALGAGNLIGAIGYVSAMVAAFALIGVVIMVLRSAARFQADSKG